MEGDRGRNKRRGERERGKGGKEKETGDKCKCARGETCFVLVRKALLQTVELAAWKKASRAFL